MASSAVLCCCFKLLWFIVLFPVFERVTEAGCGQSKLCCLGKDNKCVAKGPRDNNKNSRTCYCDSECSVNSDCCVDYKWECRAVDCTMSAWSDWSECSSRCGRGVRQRTRSIVAEAAYSGKPCGPVLEKATCEGTTCKLPRMLGGHEETKETGTIIPASFGAWRGNVLYNPYQDIRRNLFNHYQNNSTDSRTSYCAYHQLTDVRPYCLSSTSGTWTKKLAKGNVICVECQPMAMKAGLGARCVGHGHYLQETRWSAFTISKCSGKWIRKTHHAQCKCNPSNENSFILI